MKKLVIVSGMLCSFSFAAQPVFHSIGSASTIGSVTNSRSLSSSLSNPASGYLMVNSEEDDSIRFGLLGPIGVGYEVGEVDSLTDQIDELEETLDEGNILSVADATAAQEKFNDFLEEAGEKGYAKVSVVGSAPLFPLIYKSEKYGALALDVTFSGAGKLSVLDDDVALISNGATSGISTDSAIYTQSVLATTFGLGYSNSIWSTGFGDLIIGVKANATQMTLNRTVETIESYGDGDEAEGEASSANVGVDLGLLWVANNVVLGVTMANINEPEYDLGSLDNCSSSSASVANCTAVTTTFADEIDLTGTYIAEAQTTAELSFSLAEKTLSLQSSYDLNSVTDATGDEYQWSVVSLSYFGDSNWIPGLRVGLRQNLVGSELSYANAGLTFFKRLNLDVGVALETIEIDGDELPRAGYINLGFASAF